jgi:hypothetical protein
MANQYYPVANANYDGPFGHIEQENEEAQAPQAQAPPRQTMAQAAPPTPQAERQFQALEEDVDDLYNGGRHKRSRRRFKKKKSSRYKKSKKTRRRKSRRARINKK